MRESTVPVVDIAPFLSGDGAERAAVAQAVDEACRRIGFLIVAGHGVPRPAVDDCLTATWAFFDLDDAEKRRWISAKGDFRRGYLPVGGNALAYTLDRESPPDLIEAFTFGRFDLPETSYYTAHRETWFEPNIWPTRPPGLRQSLCAYYRAMERLAETLMRIFALALDMPEAFFADKIDRHITAMRLNHYAEASRPPLAGQLRAGAHTDYGSLTDPAGDGSRRRPAGARQRRDVVRCRAGTRHLHRQSRRPHGAVDQRPLGLDAAPRRQPAGGAARGQPARIHRLLPPAELRRPDRVPADLP